MYVAVKGGEAAIANAHRLLADRRRGDRSLPSITIEQVVEQLGLAVDRVMAEASLYDRALAALAVRQARGDMIEAIFILRAYRTTLPRFGYSEPVDTARMKVERRVSATYKDLPGGQLLGPTFDYTHRLLDPSLIGEDAVDEPALKEPGEHVMRVSDILDGEGLIEGDGQMPEGHVMGDLTREPMEFPMARDLRLQALARGDEGFLLALAYSTQRGYGRTHPFVGEVRIGEVEVELELPELGFAVSLGTVRSPNARWSTSSRARPNSRRSSPAATGSSSARASARRCPCRWSTGPSGQTNSTRTSSLPPRIRNSSSRMRITSRRPASSSI